MSILADYIQNKALLAPLAGITNLPFRLIARQFGCGLCFTEMISANGLVRHSSKTLEYLQTCPADQPLGIQLFGSEPSVMAEAARIVAARKPQVIDINMGCPVKKVVKTGAGAMLMKEPLLAGRIVAAVTQAVKIPVCVKIRAGWSPTTVNAVEMAKMAEDSGAAAVVVHGRTAVQGFSGHADWTVIGNVKTSVKIPVIGNGDVWKAQDALRMRENTGCDAVMVGRGALGNPWIFKGINQLFQGCAVESPPLVTDRYAIIQKHWSLELQEVGPRTAVRTFRKHLLWYTKGLPGAGRLRETIGKMTDSRGMFSELERYFRSLGPLQTEIMT